MSFFMAVAFSVLYLRRGTLTACISAHFVLDLPLFLFMLMPIPVQSQVRMEIRPESAQCEDAAAEYRAIWAREWIAATMERVSTEMPLPTTSG
jgi:hypothetical protein